MITLLGWELRRFFRRFAPYSLYLAIMLLVILTTLGLRYAPVGLLTAGVPGVQVVGDPRNALFVAQFCSTAVALLLVYLVPIVVGEIMGAEGASGFLRTLLVRPRPRWQFWLAKYLAAWVYAASVSGLLFATSLAAGYLTFGWGKMVSQASLESQRLIVMLPAEGLAYVTLSYALLTLSLMAAGTVAVALGSWFDSALAPGLLAVGLLLVLQIVGNLPFEWVMQVKPYSFASHVFDFKDVYPVAFDVDTGALKFPWAEIGPMLRVHCTTIAVAAAAGLWRFVKKDVTC